MIFLITCSFLCFIVRIHYIIQITYKIYVHRLFILSVRPPVNSRLLVVKFWRSQNWYRDFRLHGGSAPLKPLLVQGSSVHSTQNWVGGRLLWLPRCFLCIFIAELLSPWKFSEQSLHLAMGRPHSPFPHLSLAGSDSLPIYMFSLPLLRQEVSKEPGTFHLSAIRKSLILSVQEGAPWLILY